MAGFVCHADGSWEEELSTEPHRPGITVVCVYNDAEMRAECLDRSISAHTGYVDVDFVPVDNTRHAFTSAGAALNHGARQAQHDIVLFAHQDVYLHSLDRLVEAGERLRGERWGILGASGAPAAGGNAGRLRDRLQMVGSSAPQPVDVDSLDEVAIMVRRDRVLEHPLTEDPDLAWHAYAVEYGLRMRRLGLHVGAVDLGITHNSLSTNLARLDAAHRRVGDLYADLLPVRTTCGDIAPGGPHMRPARPLARHRWRLRWLQQSLQALQMRRIVPLPVVLSDVRDDVDLLSFDDASPLHLVNVDREGGFVEYGGAPLTLTRYGRPVVMSAVRPTDLARTLQARSSSESVLVADLALEDLRSVRHVLERDGRWVAGLQHGGMWLLGGPVTRTLPEEWTRRRAVPLGSPGAAGVARTGEPFRSSRS